MSLIKPKIDSKWFSDRNLKIYPYQKLCLESITESLFECEYPTILAACPSAGKTLMTIAFIDQFFQANPDAKILVLPHGTNVLKTQFYGEITKANVSFTYKMITKKEKNFDAQVIISLPQTLSNIRLSKFDLLIVDEAHHFYFAEGRGKQKGKLGLVANIIKKTKPKHQLLLTGTPSIFIRHQFPIIPVTIEELLQENVITDVIVELATSTYDFKSTDFNNSYDVTEKASKKIISQNNTNATMDELLTGVLKRLTSVVKNNPKAYANINTLTKVFTGKSWSDALGALKKTMIACNSIEQANMVQNYLTKKGVYSVISTSENDKDSEQIERFVKNPDCLVLIVVDRGVLGFNLPELENVIDMTCSYNPDKIFQLMGRVLRKHPTGKQKLFFKVVPHSMSNLYRGVMQVVALLSNKQYYTKFDGKNMMDIKLFAEAEAESGNNKKKNGSKNNSTQKRKKPTVYVPIKFEGVPFFKLFNDLYHQDNAVLNGIAYVTLRQVIDRIKGYHTNIEEVIAELEQIHNTEPVEA